MELMGEWAALLILGRSHCMIPGHFLRRRVQVQAYRYSWNGLGVCVCIIAYLEWQGRKLIEKTDFLSFNPVMLECTCSSCVDVFGGNLRPQRVRAEAAPDSPP